MSGDTQQGGQGGVLGPQQRYQPQYQNSGLARFGSIGAYQPTPYTPSIFQPQGLAPRAQYPASGLLNPTPQPQGAEQMIAAGGGGPGSDGSPGIGGAGVGTSANANMGQVASVAANAVMGNPLGALMGLAGIASNSSAPTTAIGVSSPEAIAEAQAAQDALEAAANPGAAQGGVSSGNEGPGIGATAATGGPNAAEGDGSAGAGGGGGGK